MKLIFFLIVIIMLFIGGFYITCYIIKLWTGCNTDEAAAKIQNWMNPTVQYQFQNDLGFANAVWDNVRNVIGNGRFKRLERLSNTAITIPLLFFGMDASLPFIGICVYYTDDNEKMVLENVLKNLVQYYLRIHGYSPQVITTWKMRGDLNMPYLQIQYARDKNEQRNMAFTLQQIRENIVAQHSALIDDEEEEFDE